MWINNATGGIYSGDCRVGDREATLEEISAAQALEDARLVATKVESLWAAADRYVTSHISGVAIGMLTIGVIQQKPKALAISAWSQSIWEEYYARKALVTATSDDDLDFSSFGPMPHSVPELQAEVMGD